MRGHTVAQQRAKVSRHVLVEGARPRLPQSWWYQCALRKYERYVRADCRDPKAEWTQVTPIGWWP